MDFSRVPNERDFLSMTVSPSGQCVILGSFDRFRIFDFNITRDLWEEGKIHDVKNIYSITSMAWKQDITRGSGE